MHPRALRRHRISAGFRGFRPEAFRFFRQLARNNHKAWFDRHRTTYQEHVAGALKSLFEALVPSLLELDPDFEISGHTGKNFSRINRDIRFARDKSPYRRNLYLYFGPHDNPRLDARLYVGLSADGVTCGFATYNGRQSSLTCRLKPRRAQHPQRLEKIVRRLSHGYEIYWHGVERGEWRKYRGSPGSESDWKRCKAWIVRKRFAPGRRELRSATFAKVVEKIFRQLFPLYAFSALSGPASKQALRAVPRRA